MNWRRLIGFGVASLVIAGCGTTVPNAARNSADDPSGPAPADVGGTAAPRPSGTARALDDPDAARGDDGEFATPDDDGRPTTTAPIRPGRAVVPVPPRVPGVTASTIYVGAAYTPEAGESQEAFGVAGLDPGDQRQYYDAAIRDVNKRGGIAGRVVKPVYYRVSGDSGTKSASDQAACAHWTQDNKTFALLTEGSSILLSCAEKAGTLLLSTNFSTATTSTYRRFAGFYEISAVNLERVGSVTVNGLRTHGYFAAKPTIGIVTWDVPNYREGIERGWLPALRRYGLTAQVRYIRAPDSEGELSNSTADVESAILKFRTDGVDHVMIGDGPAGVFSGTGLTLLFLKAASSQQYRPKYGFNETNSAPEGLRAGLWTREEMAGSHTIVWTDGPDDRADEGIARNPQRLRCYDIMKANRVVMDNDNARSFALAACDQVWFLETVVARATDLTRRSIGAAADALGRAYRGPLAYANLFRPGRRDGVAAARHAVYKDDCTCFRYTTGAYALP